MCLRGNGFAQSSGAVLLVDLSVRRLAEPVGLWKCRQSDSCFRCYGPSK
jgi:hypothetical protein